MGLEGGKLVYMLRERVAVEINVFQSTAKGIHGSFTNPLYDTIKEC